MFWWNNSIIGRRSSAGVRGNSSESIRVSCLPQSDEHIGNSDSHATYARTPAALARFGYDDVLVVHRPSSFTRPSKRSRGLSYKAGVT